MIIVNKKGIIFQTFGNLFYSISVPTFMFLNDFNSIQLNNNTTTNNNL